MKVLIISYLFAPNNDVGAIRPTKLAKYLVDRGHNVTVISNGYSGNDSLSVPQGLFKHFMLRSKKPAANTGSAGAAQASGVRSFIPKSVKYNYRTMLHIKEYEAFADFAFKKYAEEKADGNCYDAVFTSYGPLASVLAGLKIKQNDGDSVFWISDFRDPMVSNLSPSLFRGYYDRIQKKACKYADVITTVSNGYVKRVCRSEKYLDKVSMIPNGFDAADKPAAAESSRKNGKLNFTYVGALYEGKRDISPLFRAISELADEGVIDKEDVEFVYAGKDFAFLKSQAETYGMTDRLTDMGRLDRTDCLALQQKSDVLILSTWNDKGEEGVFPGKFIEYMLFEKPIVALVGGNLSNSEVKLVMEEGKFGVTFEQANSKEDFGKLKEYLKNCFECYKESGKMPFDPSREVYDRYNYTNIMKKLEDLMLK